MGIERFIKDKRRTKDILVMGHVVCGYPSFEENFSALEIMEKHSITSLFVYSEKNTNKPYGIVHIHDILDIGIK